MVEQCSLFLSVSAVVSFTSINRSIETSSCAITSVNLTAASSVTCQLKRSPIEVYTNQSDNLTYPL